MAKKNSFLEALILMILATFVLQPALHGVTAEVACTRSISNFWPKYFLSLDYLTFTIQPAALCSILFPTDFHNHLFFRILTVSKDTFCDTGWKYSSPPWLLIESIVPGYFPNFTWLLSVEPQWDNTSVLDLICISPAIAGTGWSCAQRTSILPEWHKFENNLNSVPCHAVSR